MLQKFTDLQIYAKMQEVLVDMESKGFNVFYIALYGSQNYGIDTEHSDLDFKCLIIPTLEQLVMQTKPFSTVFNYPWGQVEVKDIRNYIESAVKVNVNFIELLRTRHYISTNPDAARELRNYFSPLMDNLGIQYLRGCQGMIMQKFHALRHPFPSKRSVIDKFGYDPKQLCHIVRLTWLMERYVVGDYSFLHEGGEKSILIGLKEGSIEDCDADAMANHYIFQSKQIVEDYKVEPNFKVKQDMIEWSRKLIINSIENDTKNNLLKRTTS